MTPVWIYIYNKLPSQMSQEISIGFHTVTEVSYLDLLIWFHSFVDDRFLPYNNGNGHSKSLSLQLSLQTAEMSKRYSPPIK